jgi:hypothetical protein
LTSSPDCLVVVAAKMCVVTNGWAKVGNITLGNVTLGIATLGTVKSGEVVVGQTVEAATLVATGALWTGEPSGRLGVVVEVIDVDNDKGGGHFRNGLLLMTECEGFFFLEYERVASVGTF